jgi:hypothetical protein
MAQINLPTYGEAVQTSVASSASSVVLLAKNPRRKRVFIANTSTAILYVLLGTESGTATATTAHSIQMAANTNLELVGFTGAINGIWASANGQANLTELY